MPKVKGAPEAYYVGLLLPKYVHFLYNLLCKKRYSTFQHRDLIVAFQHWEINHYQFGEETNGICLLEIAIAMVISTLPRTATPRLATYNAYILRTLPTSN